MHVPTRKFLLTRRMPILPTLRTLLAATALARLEARPRGTRLAKLAARVGVTDFLDLAAGVLTSRDNAIVEGRRLPVAIHGQRARS
jgi:hypothetical protein